MTQQTAPWENWLLERDFVLLRTFGLVKWGLGSEITTSIKVGYLNCKIRPYVPNPLRCFKCQRFGHSQTACRGQLTCSRCTSVGHGSSDCSLELKCVNCSHPHSTDSKLCPKWKTEKEIQTFKTNKNISYLEARKLIDPQPSKTYAQVAKSITVNNSSQTDENITKIVCSPLKLISSLISDPKPTISSSVPAVNKSSTSTQAELVPSTSSVLVASPSKSQPPNSVIDTVPTASNSLSISAASSSSTACSVLETTTTISNTIPATSQNANQASKPRKKETCASVGHSSTDCTVEPKCVNCTQSHSSDSKLCPKGKLEKQIQEIKTNKNISYFEARKFIVPQLTQTYAQATKPSTISTTTQTDPNITNIICPPLPCLKPVSSENPMPSTSSSVSTVSMSSSSTQAHLLPSPSAIIPTIQSQSLLKIPIPTTTTTTTSPGNNLNTSLSSLETETRSLTTPNKFAALSTEIQPFVPLPESVPTISNSENSNAPEIPQCVKNRNSRNRKKRPKVQKPEIEIKMAKHKPKKSGPIEYTTDDEDMIMYDVVAEELEPNPEDKFAMKECFINNPNEYVRAFTPTRFRKSRK
ncbi:uncharacterized protein TNCV_2082941 [Trichonephila clavipes]|nr:uncharacterized protein TNCV_2082941 [Trichonephila clavipes]